MPFSVATPAVEEQEIFSWKPFTRADVSEVYELMQTVNRVDNNDHNETLDDVEREFDDPWSNPLTDGRIIRTVRGTLAAFARVFVNPKPESENVAYVWSEITPEARGQGLEQEMLEWMEHRAAERLAEVAQEHQAEQLPRVIRTDAPASNARAIALYEANDYAHARSFFKMERDLREPLPDKTLPEGLILRLYGEDIDEKLRLAFNESFGDHWGHQEITPAEWQPFVMQRSDVRRDLSLVVMDGDEIAAFCINCERVAENERLGIRRGWITKLGTRRTWRKRGLATFLLVESMRRFQAEGFDWAGLGVDAENLTGALALYENLGFRAYKTRHVWEKRSMGLYLRLTISFILCIFEYASLGFLSLEPGRRIMNNYFPRGNSTQPSGKFFENAADGGFDFNRTGWIIAASYCSLMLAVVLCYFVVFLKELGYGCFFDAERYERSNKHCCTVLFGKSFLLMWILFPAHVLCLFFIIYWDIRELREESADDAVDEVTFQHHELLTNIVFFLGDILLLKHVLVRWKALRIRDLRVSLFLETHVHLDDPDGGHGFRRRHALEEALEEEREHDNNGRRVHGAFGRRGHGRGREDFGEHSPLLPVNSHEASHLSSS